MSIPYYKIPLQLNAAVEGKELQLVGLSQSITKNLELIITTRFGEHRCDPSFGCEIWNLDFEIIVSESTWEEKLRQSLMKSIGSHELRLSNIEINVKISEVEKQKNIKLTTEIKKRVDISLKAIIQKTGESFYFSTNLFLSPLSVT
jgi:phage baseplate assembly protein W